MAQAESKPTTRRDFLRTTGAIGVAALAAAPAMAGGGTDPAFAAIDRVRAAHVALDAAVTEYSRLETLLPARRRRSDVHGGEFHLVPGDDPRWIENQRQYRLVNDAYDERMAELVDVRATTIGGVVALLREGGAFIAENAWDLAPDLMVAAADALEAMARA